MKVIKFFFVAGVVGAILLITAVVILINKMHKASEGFEMYGDLKEFRYRPGYSDMDGGYHSEQLYKGDDGKWIIEVRDKNSMSDPTVVTKYFVGFDSETYFEAYLKENKIPSLEKRNDSDDVVTDYSPWSYTIVFEKQTESGVEIQEYNLYEFKEYSDDDRSLIKAMKGLYNNLKSNKISEETVEDD